MKRFLLPIVALFMTLCLNAQTPEMPIVDGKICYTEVVHVDSTLTVSDLYTKARQWFATTYRSSNDVIQMDDKEKATIIGKANMRVYVKVMGTDYPSGWISYNIAIHSKNGRYKYEITDFYHTGEINQSLDFGNCENMINPEKKYKKACEQILQQINEKTLLLVNDLKSNMTAKQKEEEDW